MKIAQVVCVYPPYKGGIGKAASDITSELTERGHEVAVFTLPKPDTIYPGEVKKAKAWPRLGNAGLILGLFSALDHYDLVYLHYPFFGTAELVYLYRLLKKPKSKLLIHFHMDVPALGLSRSILAWPSVIAKKGLFKQADAIICASLDYVKSSSIGEIYGERPNAFREFPFLVDTEKFCPLSDKKNAERSVILFVGGMDAPHHFKGVDVLLRAFSKLKSEARLALVGDGSLRPGYERLANDLGLKEDVVFLGALDDLALAKTYRESDVFVLPSVSRHEAFGIVLLEAMASGLPVVASDLPGVRTVFENGREGYIFPPADCDGLAKILDNLLSQPELRRKMSIEARKLACTRYDKELNAERIDNLVRSL